MALEDETRLIQGRRSTILSLMHVVSPSDVANFERIVHETLCFNLFRFGRCQMEQSATWIHKRKVATEAYWLNMLSSSSSTLKLTNCPQPCMV